jgi:hypothetical protein
LVALDCAELPPPQPVKPLAATNATKPRQTSSRRLRPTGNSVSNPSSGSPQARTVKARNGLASRALAIAVVAVETVSVVLAAVPETAIDAGLKLHAAFAGKPVQEKLTVPVNPPAPATLTFVVTDWPEVTVSAVEPPLPPPKVTGASTALFTVPLEAASLASPP